MPGKLRAQPPVLENGQTVSLVPAVIPLAVTYDATISSSTEITLNAATTFIEVTAIDKGIFMKWGTDNATSSAFDEFIVGGSTRQFYVPYVAPPTAVNFLEESATAKLVCIEK